MDHRISVDIFLSPQSIYTGSKEGEREETFIGSKQAWQQTRVLPASVSDRSTLDARNRTTSIKHRMPRCELQVEMWFHVEKNCPIHASQAFEYRIEIHRTPSITIIQGCDVLWLTSMTGCIGIRFIAEVVYADKSSTKLSDGPGIIMGCDAGDLSWLALEFLQQFGRRVRQTRPAQLSMLSLEAVDHTDRDCTTLPATQPSLLPQRGVRCSNVREEARRTLVKLTQAKRNIPLSGMRAMTSSSKVVILLRLKTMLIGVSALSEMTGVSSAKSESTQWVGLLLMYTMYDDALQLGPKAACSISTSSSVDHPDVTLQPPASMLAKWSQTLMPDSLYTATVPARCKHRKHLQSELEWLGYLVDDRGMAPLLSRASRNWVGEQISEYNRRSERQLTVKYRRWARVNVFVMIIIVVLVVDGHLVISGVASRESKGCCLVEEGVKIGIIW
ncbi:hypothetical protein KCV07_g95, partial [Aureobasidium melanogenum]